MPRPDLTCPCGVTFTPAPKGPLPTRCPACEVMVKRVQSALSTIRAAMADPRFRWVSQRDGETLMDFGRQLRVDRSAVDLEDALETLERVAGVVEVEEPRRVARALDRASKRVMRQAGLLVRSSRMAPPCE